MTLLVLAVKLICAVGLLLLVLLGLTTLLPLLTAHDATGAEIDAEVEALFAPIAAPRSLGGPHED